MLRRRLLRPRIFLLRRQVLPVLLPRYQHLLPVCAGDRELLPERGLLPARPEVLWQRLLPRLSVLSVTATDEAWENAMEVVLLVVRLLLSSVFALAGVTKLLDRQGTRRAMLGFGIPSGLAAPVAAVLPFAEVAVAAALILTATAWWGALAALALLLGFTGAMGYQLARGRAPECHCFGQVSSEPVGPSTLVRNLILAVLAAVVIGAGPTRAGLSTAGRFGSTTDLHRLADYLDVMTMVLVALGSTVLVLWRQQGQLAQRLRELEADLTGDDAVAIGATATQGPSFVTASPFQLPDLTGNPVALDDLIVGGRRLLLIFSDPDCGACTTLLPQISQWQHEHADILKVAVISQGTAEANRAKVDQYLVAPVLLQRDREVSEAYRVPGTPCAILVNPDGTTNRTVACGESEIRNLVAQAVGVPARRSLHVVSSHTNSGGTQPGMDHVDGGLSPVATVGTPAPGFLLPDIDGRLVKLDDLRGDQTLLLFWNPDCGHCEAMLPELRDWETRSAPEGVRLVLISTGDVEANRALGLSSRILLDENFTTGRAFGVSGTPMAVLVDDGGRIASTIAAGASAFWKLVGRP
jgi:peroxiredoxin/uncharacterized membrane protein YphA (DoxX/SURF4 family)